MKEGRQSSGRRGVVPPPRATLAGAGPQETQQKKKQDAERLSIDILGKMKAL